MLEDLKYCDKLCNPEADVHSEECIKRWVRAQLCPYCMAGDDCTVCGRNERKPAC